MESRAGVASACAVLQTAAWVDRPTGFKTKTLRTQSRKACRDRRLRYHSAMRDTSWVKARIAARILLRQRDGKVTARDRRLGPLLGEDGAVTDRLIDQALASICAQKGLSLQHYAA